MIDTIYLIADRSGVQAMRKSLVDVKRGQVIVRLNVNFAPDAFNPPVIEQEIYVDSWTKGIDLGDVEFKQSVITEEEAQVIRERRLQKVREVLESQGYGVTPPEGES